MYYPLPLAGLGLHAPTPGAIAEDFSVWVGILVTSAAHGNQTALVQSATADGQCSIQLGSLDAQGAWVGSGAGLPADARSLALVRPQKRDRVRILRSDAYEDVGRNGILIGIDNADGIIKCDNEGGMKIQDLSCIGRLI